MSSTFFMVLQPSAFGAIRFVDEGGQRAQLRVVQPGQREVHGGQRRPGVLPLAAQRPQPTEEALKRISCPIAPELLKEL